MYIGDFGETESKPWRGQYFFNRGRVAGVAVAPEGDVFDRCCKNIEPNAMHSTKNKITHYLNGLILKITNCIYH